MHPLSGSKWSIMAPESTAPQGVRVRLQILLFVGSNTLGEKAVPELAKAYLEREKHVSPATISPQGESIYVSGKMPDGTTAYIEIHATGSGDCFKSFAGLYPAADAPCDIGMSSGRSSRANWKS